MFLKEKLFVLENLLYPLILVFNDTMKTKVVWWQGASPSKINNEFISAQVKNLLEIDFVDKIQKTVYKEERTYIILLIYLKVGI